MTGHPPLTNIYRVSIKKLPKLNIYLPINNQNQNSNKQVKFIFKRYNLIFNICNPLWVNLLGGPDVTPRLSNWEGGGQLTHHFEGRLILLVQCKVTSKYTTGVTALMFRIKVKPFTSSLYFKAYVSLLFIGLIFCIEAFRTEVPVYFW